MRRLFWPALLGAFFGLVVAEAIYRLPPLRAFVGRNCGRGELLAIAGGSGIYESDLDVRAGTLRQLIVAENLRFKSRLEVISDARLDREITLLRSQFATEGLFKRVMASSGLSPDSLRNTVRVQLRSLDWLEQQLLADNARPAAEAIQQFFATHRRQFLQPLRLRAAHFFLAAHAETLPEVVEEKRGLIEEIAREISRGGSFEQLVSNSSEDEATKKRGGDLDFFSSSRVPADFYDQVAKLKTGQLSRPLQTHLGFHLVRLTEVRPPREISRDVAQEEISRIIENKIRREQIARMATQLEYADYIRPDR